MCKIPYILIQKNSQKYNTAKCKNMGTLTIENVKKYILWLWHSYVLKA